MIEYKEFLSALRSNFLNTPGLDLEAGFVFPEAVGKVDFPPLYR